MSAQQNLFYRGKVRHDHPDTSYEAAEKITEKRLNALQERVFSKFELYKRLTDEQIADCTDLNPTTVRVRRIELVEMGKLRDSGRKARNRNGRNMIVWEIAE